MVDFQWPGFYAHEIGIPSTRTEEIRIIMSDLARRIRDHWKQHGDLRSILADLERKGIDLDAAGSESLAAHDQLHSGQLEGTRVFSRWVGVRRGDRVLDIGAGLGGAARYLAEKFDSRVTAVDISPELVETGGILTRRLGLEEKVRHLCRDHTRLDPGERYDIVWIQHMDMHVPDKAELYEAAVSVLDRGGRVVWHDWLAGPGGTPRWPVMWTHDGGLSFLVPESGFRNRLETAGLSLTRFEIVTGRTTAWFERSRQGIRKILSRLTPEAPATAETVKRLQGLSLEVDNLLANLAEERLVPFFCEARRLECR